MIEKEVQKNEDSILLSLFSIQVDVFLGYE